MGADSLLKKSNKIDSVQALRGIAFLGIASFHCGLSLFGPWSVTIFFVMSGFLMMYSYINRPVECSVKNSFLFSVRKIKKLYPLYLITLIVMIILEKGAPLKIIAADLLLLQSWIPNSGVYFSLNGVAWFFSDMLFIYMLFPLVRYAIKKYKNRQSAIWVSFVLFALLSAITVSARFIGARHESLQEICKWVAYIFPVTRLGDFVIGCNLCFFFMGAKNNLSTVKATSLEVVAVLATGISQVVFYINAKNEVVDYMAYIYLPIAVLCVYLFTVKRGLLTELCSNKLLIYIGNVSGQAFLLHRPTMNYLYSFIKIDSLTHRIYDIIIFMVSVIITVALSALYIKIENVIKEKKTKIK